MTITTKNYNIFINKGDTGPLYFTVDNLIPNQDYKAYFQVTMSEKKIKKQTAVIADENGIAELLFSFEKNESNEYEVGNHIYGLKLCTNETSDTYIPTPCRSGLFCVLEEVVSEDDNAN